MVEQLNLNFDKKPSKKELLDRIIQLETEIVVLRSKIAILENNSYIWRNPGYNPAPWPTYPQIWCKDVTIG